MESGEADGGITVNFGGTERKIIFPVGGEGGEHFVTLTEDGQLTLTPLYEVEGEPNFKIITSNARTFHPDGSVTVADGQIQCESENSSCINCQQTNYSSIRKQHTY